MMVMVVNLPRQSIYYVSMNCTQYYYRGARAVPRCTIVLTPSSTLRQSTSNVVMARDEKRLHA